MTIPAGNPKYRSGPSRIPLNQIGLGTAHEVSPTHNDCRLENSLEILILIRLHDRSLSNRNFLRSAAFLVPPAHKLALKNRYKLCTIAQLTFLSFCCAHCATSALRTVAELVARMVGSEPPLIVRNLRKEYRVPGGRDGHDGNPS